MIDPCLTARKPKRYFCGHCDENVSKTLFFEYRKLFYDKLAKRWRKERVVQAGLGEEFDFTQAKREDLIDTVAETTGIECYNNNIKYDCYNYYTSNPRDFC